MLISLLTLIVAVQIVYYSIFNTFFTLYSATGTGAVMQYWREILSAIWECLIPLLLLSVPLAVYLFLSRFRRLGVKLGWKPAILSGLSAVLVQMMVLMLINISSAGVLPIRYIYREAFIPTLSISNFGVLTTLRLDVQQLVLGSTGGEDMLDDETLLTPPAEEASPASEGADASPSQSPVDIEPSPIQYKDQVLEIDFDALIAGETDRTLAEMHQYFSKVEPTKTNAYTGMFEGKNLIWICAEAFSSLAIQKDLTPTLYKLSNEGFVFKNFYNPVWGVSTSDGEYVTCTGLIPKSGVWSFYRSASNSMPFTFGNQLSSLGYQTMAYHNHTYNYYHRDVSHPNMGYTYKAVGNGLEVKRTWPESDLEMMQVTIPEYVARSPFHTYYMTVSGHLNYTFNGNMMAAVNKDAVNGLPYSEPARAYLACNLEFEKAMSLLIEQLRKADVLEDTVIVISGDHYPYGLKVGEMSELAGHPLETNFEIYKSTLIIWSSAMKEPIVVEKPCSALDILPTLSNLMGVRYDSRLLMGQDILSDAEPLVIFSNRSWITDKGRYNSQKDSFEIKEGAVVEDGYARAMVAVVNGKFKYSAKILETDYYAHVLQTSGE